MATEIKMPQLSDTMHAGKILAWKKREGEKVARGDILAEVETDKANLEIEAFQPGTLLKIIVPAQSTANVGDIIAVIGEQGENVAARQPSQAVPAPEQSKALTPPKPDKVLNESTARSSAPTENIHSTSDRIKASPLARKLAEQRNIDLSKLHGSGPDGRIIKKDLDSASPGSSRLHEMRPASRQSEVAQQTGGTQGTFTPFSKMRETIAKRMQESVAEAPHFYVTTSINMREAVRLREVLKEKPEYKGISINHLIIKAAAYALAHEPRVNRAVRNDQVYDPGQVNIGIITAIEDGLLIPVVKDADRLSLKDITFEARAAVERARAGRPGAGDLVGGTFSISNMGMYDVENFTAIINPGQGAVLAVSSVREEPVIENGQIAKGLRMKVTISVDHRIIDGVMAGNFLKFFKEALEIPALLMV